MSKFLILPLSIAAAALLSACAHREPAPIVVVPPATPPAPAVVTAPQSAPAPSAPVAAAAASIRPGFGRIESMTPVAATASSGSSTPSAMNRLNIRMDDGNLQLIDTPSAGLQVGDRVELTREGYIRRIPQ
ncbi:MAG TPA: hypothetical protein VNU96_15050 [Burkholderiales bacterium]|jgi:hypothetical protein|nr:hypothetical protein [Burkholderiales bacterium]